MVEQKWVELYPELYGDNAVDPDEGRGDIELNDILTEEITKLIGREAYGGLFSTWAERHSFITGFNIGITLKEMEAVPTPKFWASEAHYFKSGVTLGYLSRSIDIVPILKLFLSLAK